MQILAKTFHTSVFENLQRIVSTSPSKLIKSSAKQCETWFSPTCPIRPRPVGFAPLSGYSHQRRTTSPQVLSETLTRAALEAQKTLLFRVIGNSDCFLFTLNPLMSIYHPTGINEHYMYLNVGMQTIPNGLVSITRYLSFH